MRRDEVALRLEGIAAEFDHLARQRTEIRAALDLLDRQLRAVRQRDRDLEAQMAVLARRMALLEPLAGPGPGRPAAAARHPPHRLARATGQPAAPPTGPRLVLEY